MRILLLALVMIWITSLAISAAFGADVPVVGLAGQSNAARPPLDSHVVNEFRRRGIEIVWVKTAEGSTMLAEDPTRNDWNAATAGELTDMMIANLNAARQAIMDAGHTPRIVGMLWVHGESDSRTQANASAYQSNYTAMVNKAWNSVGMFPWYISQLSTNFYPYVATTKQAQRDIVASLPSHYMVPTDGLAFVDETQVHYTADAAAELARRFVDQVVANNPWLIGNQHPFPTKMKLLFSTFDDVVSGTPYGDWYDLGAGNDTVNGGAGDDVMYGNDGDDILRGGAGNDILRGGLGYDILRGGTGNDVFLFTNPNESKPDKPDRIMDFETGDKIDLKYFAPFWRSYTSFTGSPGELVLRLDGAGNSRVMIDFNGDRIADLEIVVVGRPDLTRADFLLDQSEKPR